jgi:hypothetical protein
MIRAKGKWMQNTYKLRSTRIKGTLNLISDGFDVMVEAAPGDPGQLSGLVEKVGSTKSFFGKTVFNLGILSFFPGSKNGLPPPLF